MRGTSSTLGWVMIGAFVAFSAGAALAQVEPGTVTRVTVWEVKEGMEAKFEEGLARHNDWHRKQNDSWTLATVRVLSGPNTGKLARITGGRSWKDFDDEMTRAEADDADAAKNMDPFLAGAETSYYVHLPAVSRSGDAGPPAAMSLIVFIHLNQGKTGDFTHLMQKIHEASGKTEWPVRYNWYALANGGEHPTFVVVLPRSNWADFEDPEVSFPAMLEQAFGRAESTDLLDKLGETIHCQRSEIVRYLPELSYMPAR